MNIFIVDYCPKKAATMLPDKHVVKMSLEACQILSVIYSSWHYNWGDLPKANGDAYKTTKGIYRNHPATLWAKENYANLAWLIVHGQALCDEYFYRYGKVHGCAITLAHAAEIFTTKTGKNLTTYKEVDNFVRIMPDEFKNDLSIDTAQAYRDYVASKPWAANNYIKKPDRKPAWLDLL